MAVLLWDVSGALAFLSFPGSSFLVNAISWISLALGLFFIVPSLLAVVFDILLWIWRTFTQAPDGRAPAAAGSAAAIVAATAATTTTIGSEHGDQRARRR
ncbi:hypothetical protein N5P37_001118 [Trichoderma harzianum]|uniref:Uncharacterized protein n=1 Tax=Trichoderma harzianum CBS 226.95 TaxID=983964 RepID=A0A2T4AGP5_TRIHA|nr:hypothetical protein M431DRAFT_3460 [Trichoderma harzianum CBS 226.95]KAK0766226.1 hypothetical protein N5P37_001118 [Trichoderma harzianum]PKK45665.1 hypothetical protein CI102_10451 [Trichoderma harzianum]PTB56261.1 hypothetical protein M431DRAFT_3460 [Trichoderma harzianum CBS 226.95]